MRSFVLNAQIFTTKIFLQAFFFTSPHILLLIANIIPYFEHLLCFILISKYSVLSIYRKPLITNLSCYGQNYTKIAHKLFLGKLNKKSPITLRFELQRYCLNLKLKTPVVVINTDKRKQVSDVTKKSGSFLSLTQRRWGTVIHSAQWRSALHNKMFLHSAPK